jgi:thymidylate synthase
MAGWLDLEIGSYTHMVSSLHFYNHDLDALKGATDCTPVFNPDDLRIAKAESETCFASLNSILNEISAENTRIEELVETLFKASLPLAYQSIGLTVLAESARRRKNELLASQLAAKISNPCLSSLIGRWFIRNPSQSKLSLS